MAENVDPRRKPAWFGNLIREFPLERSATYKSRTFGRQVAAVQRARVQAAARGQQYDEGRHRCRPSGLVEAGGIEPPSASPTLQDLHAYPVYCSRTGLPDRQGRPGASPVLFDPALPGTRTQGDPVIATPSPPAQARRRVE